ncbi:MAG: Hsp20/alpha crystallin family protein [Burkholderiaceae bacterium]
MSNLRTYNLFSMDPVDELFSGFFKPVRGNEALQAPQIRVDVNEKEDAFVVKADIPGIRKEDIDVSVNGNSLTISAEVKKESDEKKDGKVLRSERYYGVATRSMSFGNDVDATAAKAKYENGVLELTLPKKASQQTKRLAVA